MPELPAFRQLRPGRPAPPAGMRAHVDDAPATGSASSPRRVHARVDAGAVAHNLATLRGLTRSDGPAPRIWATVKADAYGHGVARVLPGLVDADGLAVAQLADAHACREAGWNGPILVYGGLLDADDIASICIPGLHLVISHPAQLDWLESADATLPAISIWLRYAGDLGMNGFDALSYLDAYRRGVALMDRGRVSTVGHFQHYGQGECRASVARADADLDALISGLPGPRSAGNSASLLHPLVAAPASDTAMARCAADWVRPGLALYGASPLPGLNGAALGLRPAMSLHSRLISVRTVAAGERLGYGGAFVAPHAMRVGMVGCGYGDGYPRLAPAGTPVSVDGVLVDTLGVVTMDSLLVDLTRAPDADVGTRVTLWGSEELPVEVVARHAGTIAAALLTALTARVAFNAF